MFSVYFDGRHDLTLLTVTVLSKNSFINDRLTPDIEYLRYFVVSNVNKQNKVLDSFPAKNVYARLGLWTKVGH